MDNKLKIASTEEASQFFDTDREVVSATDTDFVDVAAVVVNEDDTDIVDAVEATKFDIPVFVISKDATKVSPELMAKIYHILDLNNSYDHRLYDREIEHAAEQYEDGILPPFFKELKAYVERGNIQFDCPGHQGGQYFP